MVAQKGKYTTISLFSGAMGLDLGLEATGQFELLACVEKESSFCDTIKLNRDKGRLSNPNLRVFEGDISTIDPLEVLNAVGLAPGELDLLVGGPPCQSFSTAGRRGTVQDPRGTLLWQFLRFVEVMQPKFFLMENVRGLISAALRHRPIKDRPDKGGASLEPDEEQGSVVRLFADDLGCLPDVSYRMDCFEVNAVNYGAPQLRERALFIGNRLDQVVDFPNPTHGQQLVNPTRDQQLPLLDTGAPELLPYRTLGDAIRGLREENPVIMDFSPRKKHFLSMVPPGSNWRSLPEELQRESMGKAWYAKGGRSGWWRRLGYDLPCPTIVTMPNHASTALCHPEEVRALTVRECALVQEFPPDWEFTGTPPQQYAQVGNAVPVRLGRMAGQVIADHLSSPQNHMPRAASDALPLFRIVYIQSHVRTRQWYKAGKTFIWKDGDDNRGTVYGEPVTVRRVREVIGRV